MTDLREKRAEIAREAAEGIEPHDWECSSLGRDTPCDCDRPARVEATAAAIESALSRYHALVTERAARFEETLREIARGKVAADMGNGWICAARLSGLARAALSLAEALPEEK